MSFAIPKSACVEAKASLPPDIKMHWLLYYFFFYYFLFLRILYYHLFLIFYLRRIRGILVWIRIEFFYAIIQNNRVETFLLSVSQSICQVLQLQVHEANLEAVEKEQIGGKSLVLNEFLAEHYLVELYVLQQVLHILFPRRRLIVNRRELFLHSIGQFASFFKPEKQHRVLFANESVLLSVSLFFCQAFFEQEGCFLVA